MVAAASVETMGAIPPLSPATTAAAITTVALETSNNAIIANKTLTMSIEYDDAKTELGSIASSSTALLPNSSLGLMDEDVISSAEGAEDEIDAIHTLLHETGDGRLLQPPRAPGATATAAEQMVGGQTTHSRATGSVKAGSGFFVSFTGTAL